MEIYDYKELKEKQAGKISNREKLTRKKRGMRNTFNRNPYSLVVAAVAAQVPLTADSQLEGIFWGKKITLI